MRASAIGLASLVLVDSSVAAFDTCSAGATDIFSTNACCPTSAPPRRRRLFSRNDVCSDGSNPCCTAKAPGPPVVASGARTDLQCGRNFGDDSQDVPGGVTYAIEPCPDPGPYAGQTCLHIKLTAAPGQTVSDIHLAILDGDGDPNSLPNGLGNWPHNSYCSFSGSQGDCWVPVSVVAAVLDPPSTSLCDQDIIIAVGISITGATCFARGTPIGDPNSGGRWFMYTTADFTCPDICTQSCCCGGPPPVHSCDIGTAYGNNPTAITLNSLTPNNCKHWGWYFKVNSATLSGSGLTGNLIVGAGGNDLSKGINVGTFSAVLSGTSLTVTYTLLSGFDLGEVHIYASCSLPGSCAPGQFGNPSTPPDLSGSTDTSFQTTITVGPCTNYFLIFHAKINQVLPLATPCPTPVT